MVNAKLMIPRFANMGQYNTIVVKVRFLDIPSRGLSALVSNGDCCDQDATMALVKSRQHVHYMAKCDSGSVSTFHLPYQTGTWNDAYYIHDKFNLEGLSNNMMDKFFAVGSIKASQAALQIGFSKGFKNFHGYMDEVSCRKVTDFVIGVDASDSISAPNFELFKNSIADLIRRIDIGEGRARMGIVVYSTTVTLTVPLSSNKDMLRLMAMKLPHAREGTSTEKAINVMRGIFQKQKRDAPKIGIILTDGISKNPTLTANEAKLTRDLGITMFAVGVSKHAEMKELEAIAGNVCESCIWYSNNICYVSHPEECALYIECYRKNVYGRKPEITHQIKTCPFGKFWNQLTLSCHKCKIPGTVSYIYTDEYMRNKRAYWKCVNHKSVPHCCSKGQIYEPNVGCIKDKSCSWYSNKCFEECPLDKDNKNVCLTKPYGYYKSKYLMYVEGMGWTGPHHCESGTEYDKRHCGCKQVNTKHKSKKVCKKELFLPFDTDLLDWSGNQVLVRNVGVHLTGKGAAYFDGHSKIVIPKLPIMNKYAELVIQMKYLEIGKGDTSAHALFSNSDCVMCKHPPPATVSLTSTKDYLHYSIKTSKKPATTMKIASKSCDWNSVEYRHDRYNLYGNSNGLKNYRFALGRINNNNAPLQIGFNHGTKNFKGYIDEFIVYSCKYLRYLGVVSFQRYSVSIVFCLMYQFYEKMYLSFGIVNS
ncbi:hypothetical protein KUTeg_023516 [Tegillarca granosa]|uniref:VWFA domain-containing protein n=1 Tax=Tegillarca granosa TaxID=220873 RepID=A0ABQ9E6S7_TEGGR|nr:hypothetical protein KUTeg_023516 [Tegillarca granosa]